MGILGAIARLLGVPLIGRLHQYPARQIHIPKHYLMTNFLRPAPRISIVTPSFNQGRFLERTIKSVLSQDYPNLEYIIQDGGSTDETVDILEKYDGALKHWESERDNGQAHAINLGFRHARGEIMAYLNSDDLLLPGTLNYVARFFNTHQEVSVIYGHRVIIDEYDREIGRWVLPPHRAEVIRWDDYVPQETLFWRRSIWDNVGGCVDESFRFAMDWDLILRFQNAGATMVRVPRFLGAFRVYEEQKTTSQIETIGIQEINRIREREWGGAIVSARLHRAIKYYLLAHIFLHISYRLKIIRY